MMALAPATDFEVGVGVGVLTFAAAGVAFSLLAELLRKRNQMSITSREWGDSIDEQQRRLKLRFVGDPPLTSEAPEPPTYPPIQQDRDEQAVELAAQMRSLRETPPKSDKQKIAELRAIIEKQSQENAALLEAAVQFRQERDHWKSNHDNQVKLKQTISRRKMITEQRSETAYDPHRREGCECAARARELAIANSAMSRELAEAHKRVQELSSLKDREQELIYAKNELQGQLHRANQSLRDLRQNVDAVQSGQMQAELDRLKAELAAAPHWVPVAEFENDSKFHIVWDANYAEVTVAKRRKRSSEWSVAYCSELRIDVTHVLVGLNPPVAEQCIDPRGDGDVDEVVPDTDVKLSVEQMADAQICKHEERRTVLGTPYDSHSIECVDCGCDISNKDSAGDASERY